MNRSLLIFWAVVLGLAAGFTATEAWTHVSRRGTGAPRKLVDAKTRFPNIQLYTQDNQAVRFYDGLVKNKIVIINFMYTTCTGT